jgi:hypothetical protein
MFYLKASLKARDFLPFPEADIKTKFILVGRTQRAPSSYLAANRFRCAVEFIS